MLLYNNLTPIFSHSKTLFCLGEEEGKAVLYKVLKNEQLSARELASFRNEFNILNEIECRGVRRAVRTERLDGRHALVLEWVEGVDLSQLEGPLSLERFLSIATQAAQILADIHHLNLIHKDIKPENFIYHSETDQLTLIDFGLASRFDAKAGFLAPSDHLEGSLHYISPEQTGRMNRSVDQRSDLYSLGASFYRLLAGRPPFEARDELELVHAHIAKEPLPLRKLNAQLPLVIVEIIEKLMQKNAEDRYQSAAGLLSDLRQASADYNQRGQIATFTLGQSDVSRSFKIPEKLYGRSEAVARLMASFERSRQGGRELVLVSGHSGTGKSVLVQELYRPVTLNNGYFLTGKFERLQRDVPYSALIQAFNEFIDHLIAQGSDALTYWRQRILASLGDLGRVLTNLLPNLVYVIGEQPAVPELKDHEAHNRLLYVFRRFLSAMADAAHPFVVFLDDLQWSDLASLELIRSMVTDEKIGHFLLICAFRDNEVNEQHPVRRRLNDIQESLGALEELRLEVLKTEDLVELCAESFLRPPDEVLALAQALKEKTQGNAFFTRQFLTALAQQGTVYFNETDHRWDWKLKAVTSQEATENVVSFLTQKIRFLPEGTQRLLQYAACVGTRFDLASLRAATKEPLSEIVKGLEIAILEGVIAPVGAEYHLIASSVDEEFGSDNHCVFVHDRLQEAVYSTLGEGERQQAHYRIGSQLLKSQADSRQVDNPFAVANQLNLGRDLISSEEERLQLAQINLQAGRRAKDSAAFTSAYQYFSAGSALLGEAHWQSGYGVRLALAEGLADSAFLCGRLDEAEAVADQGIAKAKNRLDALELHITLMMVARGRYQPERVLTLGLEVLRSLGVVFPKNPKPPHILSSLIKTKLALRSHRIEDLADLPQMSDPNKIRAMLLITTMVPDAFRLGSNLFPLFVLKEVFLSLKFGNNAVSLFGYAAFGITLSGVLGDWKGGYRFGKLALSMVDKVKDGKSFEPHVNYIFCNFLRHWQEPLAGYVDDFMVAYQKGLETGFLYEAAWGALGRGAWGFFMGRPFDLIESQMSETHETLQQDNAAASVAKMLHQTMANLRLKPEEPARLRGLIYDEEAGHQHASAEAGYLQCFKALLGFLYEEYDEALKACEKLEGNVEGIMATPLVTLSAFYSALIRLMLFERDGSPLLLKAIKKSLKKLQKCAEAVPETHLHRCALIQAEMSRIGGQLAQAREYYDQAIQAVRRQENGLEEAIILERAAHFYLKLGQNTFSAPLALLAKSRYEQLGAVAKAKLLANQLESVLEVHPRGLGETRSPALFNTSQGHSSSGSSSQSLDLNAVIQASLAISSEIKLESLIERLMKILLEAGGAQKAVLALERNGQMLVQACYDAEGKLSGGSQEGIALERFDEASISVLRYVARAKQHVVLADALKDHRFLSDPYIQKHQVKSILSAPIISHGRLVGLLYLENNLLFGAFTPTRLQVLNMLSSQAAISLENALLYQTMERQVDQRTAELDEANRTKDKFFSIISHDLRGPIGSLSVIFNEVISQPSDLSEPMLEGVARSTKQTYELLENLLTWANSQSGQLTFEPVSFPINQAIEENLHLLQGPADQKQIQLNYVAEPDHYAFGDPAMITTVIRNLLGNALKYTAAGGQIQLETKKRKGQLEVLVRDNGVGMTHDRLSNLFSIAGNLRSSRGTNNETGTGLGLILCREFIEKNGGKIEAFSELGKGSLFSFTLPLGRGPELSKALPRAQGLGGLRLLVAEDSMLHQISTSKVLRDLGLAFEMVGDGRAAVEQVKAAAFDLVLMDIDMPILDGIDATAAIRQLEGPQPKVVALTSFSAEELSARGAALDSHLVKPLRSEALLEVLERLGFTDPA
ncbi:MAG: AAA family ATPase [bacterium]|nr:AAA family ATPase [bacterium]